MIDHCSKCIQKRSICPALQAKVQLDFQSGHSDIRQLVCSAVQRAEKEKANEVSKLD